MKSLCLLGTLLCLGLCVAACDQATTPDLEVGPNVHALSTHLDQLTLYIAHQQKECVGEATQLCFLVKEKPEHDWIYFYDPIQGFTYEPGFTYKILVGLTRIENPPQDGSSIAWRLIEVLEKVKV